MSKLATVKELKRPERPRTVTDLSRLNLFSEKNVARRKAREDGKDTIVSPQSPVTESDMAPYMAKHTETAEAVLGHIDENMSFLAEKFKGVKLYKLTEDAVKRSVDQVGETVFKAAVTKELVNTMMRNLQAHKIFADKLVKIRIASAQNDVATLVDELVEFSKFFDTELWSNLNVLTEKVWDTTGFAVGRFTRDFHLQWMRLLKDPFVQSVMSSVAEAARSLTSYREISAQFVKERKKIEATIGEAPVLEKLRNELMELYAEYQKALEECNRLMTILQHNQSDPLNSVSITEAEVQAARELANDLDYKVEQAITKYYVALGSVITADENAAAARLAGHAIQLHVRTVADLFFSCGMFVLNTAAFFAAKQLLLVADRTHKLSRQGKTASSLHGVKDDLRKLEQNKIKS